MPLAAKVVALLETVSEPEEAAAAIEELFAIVQGDLRKLMQIFDATDSKAEPVYLGVFNEVLEAMASDLPIELLVKIVELTLRDLRGPVFSATVHAARGIADAGDPDAQARVVRAYIAAYEHYDAGHLSTVQDKLIRLVFTKFLPGPIADLLDWCRVDHLSRAGGDGMDRLFAPAIASADAPTAMRLNDRFARYERELGDPKRSKEIRDEIEKLSHGRLPLERSD